MAADGGPKLKHQCVGIAPGLGISERFLPRICVLTSPPLEDFSKTLRSAVKSGYTRLGCRVLNYALCVSVVVLSVACGCGATNFPQLVAIILSQRRNREVGFIIEDPAPQEACTPMSHDVPTVISKSLILGAPRAKSLS